MTIKFHSPVLFTEDFDKMKKFYLNVLQQEIEHDFGNSINFKCGLSLWALKDNYTIAQKLGYLYHKQGNKNLELCFESDNFESAYAELQKHEIKFLHKEIEEPWGQKTTRFFDPENNIIELGETIPCFVKRFYNTGLSPEEVSERTSVSLKHVTEILQNE